MGQLPDKLKPASSAVMAFAALFEEAGLTAEVSAGGLSNILLVASQNSTLFAKQLGMSKQAVQDLISTNPNDFLQKLAISFKNASGVELGEKLAKLKINSQESVKVIGILTDKIADLKTKQDGVNSSMEEASRITEVFNQKNEDEAAVVAKAGKVWDGWMNGLAKGINNILFPLTKGIASLGEKSKTLTDQFKEGSKNTAELEKKLDNLLKKQDALQSNTTNSAVAYKEVQKAMADIVQVVPQAATQYNEFGRIVKFNIGIVNDFITKQKEANQLMKGQIEKETIDRIDKLTQKSQGLKDRLQVLTNYSNSNSIARLFYQKEIAQLSQDLGNIQNQIQTERNSLFHFDMPEPPKRRKKKKKLLWLEKAKMMTIRKRTRNIKLCSSE
jgi:hypothetical protein